MLSAIPEGEMERASGRYTLRRTEQGVEYFVDGLLVCRHTDAAIGFLVDHLWEFLAPGWVPETRPVKLPGDPNA